MIKFKNITSAFILALLLISMFSSVILLSSADSVYNARCVVDIEWSDAEVDKPIIPRDEIKKIDLTVKFRIDTGESFGLGLLTGYSAGADPPNALIDLEIIETSPWCSAILESTTVSSNLTKESETTASIYLNINENAPAYGEGYITIKARARPLGLIEEYENTYTLYFLPSYLPIISIDLPDVNSLRIDPNDKATFPIKIENLGNARTKVFLDIKNVPEGWSATVTDNVILDEAKGSEATAYLTIYPPSELGYHEEEATISVSITPARAENVEERGNSQFATFIVKNMGFSYNGIETILLVLFIILIIVIVFFKIFSKVLTQKKT